MPDRGHLEFREIRKKYPGKDFELNESLKIVSQDCVYLIDPAKANFKAYWIILPESSCLINRLRIQCKLICSSNIFNLNRRLKIDYRIQIRAFDRSFEHPYTTEIV